MSPFLIMTFSFLLGTILIHPHSSLIEFSVLSSMSYFTLHGVNCSLRRRSALITDRFLLNESIWRKRFIKKRAIKKFRCFAVNERTSRFVLCFSGAAVLVYVPVGRIYRHCDDLQHHQARGNRAAAHAQPEILLLGC